MKNILKINANKLGFVPSCDYICYVNQIYSLSLIPISLVMKQDQINEMREINLALIRQNQEMIPSSDQWENESENAKINYAAGYKAALEFTNNQLNRIEKNHSLHHLEYLQNCTPHPLDPDNTYCI